MHASVEPADSGMASIQRFDAVVVGAGFAGMYATYRLRKLGLSLRVFEAGEGVGGTWYWNRYPGARVDGESLQYSYSFSPELQEDWHWTEIYASQPELLAYANHVADRFDLRRDMQFVTRVTSATFDERSTRWIVETDRGDLVSCQYLITAVGCLSATNIPDIKGLNDFGGDWYHTSNWPKNGVDLVGKNVGIIGTGSTGIQVIPVVAQQAQQLYVFQRTPNYSLPTRNTPMDPQYEREWKDSYAARRAEASMTHFGSNLGERGSLSALEVTTGERDLIYEEAWGQHAIKVLLTFNDLLTNRDANDTVAAFVRNKIRAVVNDPSIADRLVPVDYPIGTKRICMDTNYYEAFNRENVTLVDLRQQPITKIVADGVETTDSTYALDVLVLATGFDAMTGPLVRLGIVGKQKQKLGDKWESGPLTYLGIATHGFPNLFMITGPGSPSVLSSMITSIEQNVNWISDCIAYLEDHNLSTIEATALAETQWTDHVTDVADSMLFKHANSWYYGANIPGRPRVFMPYAGGVPAYREKCDKVRESGYDGFVLA